MDGRGLVLLLLVSAGSLVWGLQSVPTVSRFRYVDLLRNWTEAQSYCRENFSDLATILTDANIIKAQEAAGSSQFWIGLYRGPWYLFYTELSNTTVSMWNTSEPPSGWCPAIWYGGSVIPLSCESSYPYFCTDSSPYYHSDLTTWSIARDHCQSVHNGMGVIKSLAQSIAFTNIMWSYSYRYAWIGRDSRFFRWSEGSSSSYSRMDPVNAEAGGDCAMMNSSTGTWSWQPCDGKHSFLCRADVPLPTSKLRTVRVRMRAGSADLNEPAVQEAIIQQLQQRMEEPGIMEEVKLRWKTQPDGKVFHREGETAPPGVCRKEDGCVTL